MNFLHKILTFLLPENIFIFFLSLFIHPPSERSSTEETKRKNLGNFYPKVILRGGGRATLFMERLPLRFQLAMDPKWKFS